MRSKDINNIENLIPALREQGYIIGQPQALLVWAALHNRPTSGAFLFGPAGSGKSYLPQALAKVLGKEIVFCQCFPGTREDDLLVKLIPDDESRSGIKAVDGPILEAAKLSQDRAVFLVLDEWDKTRPSADSFLLDFLQSGRIRFNGRSCTARLENLVVWITANDERELSEPLLRRLPLIRFDHLPASLVREALGMSHPGHPYTEAALALYQRCLMAGLPKPATIQELRQLLDAANLLGDRADWDSLVFTFVTKTRENHILLKSVEDAPLNEAKGGQDGTENAVLDPGAYTLPEEDYSKPEPAPVAPKMPPVRNIVSVADKPAADEALPDLSTSGGAVSLSDTAYDAVVRMADNPTDDPKQIGDVGKVVGDWIVLSKPIPLADVRQILPLIGKPGSVVLTETGITIEDIKYLQSKYGWQIVSYASREVIARKKGVTLRWTPQGTEIVVRLDEWRECLDSTPSGETLFGLVALPHGSGRYCSGCDDCHAALRATCGARRCGILDLREQDKTAGGSE